MISLKRWLFHKLLQLFRADVKELSYTHLTREQREGMLAQLWETPAFRNYLIKRETELVLSMTDRLMKPSDEEYVILYGRRLELMQLHDEARDCFNRTLTRRKERSLASAQKDSA